MRNAEYWAERALNELLMGERSVLEYEDALLQAYTIALREIKKDIDAFFTRYANQHKISYAEARKRLTTPELKEFQALVNKWLQEAQAGKWSYEYIRYLEQLAGAKYVSRLEMLEADVRYQIELIEQRKHIDITDLMSINYLAAFYERSYTIAHGTEIAVRFNAVSKAGVEKAVKTKWSQHSYSQTIWNDRDKLVHAMSTIIPQSFSRGLSSNQLGDMIAKEMNASRNRGRTLARTEVNYICNQADLDAYKAAGVEKYGYLATLDLRTSDICRSLDGTIHKVSQAKVGVNFPPMHPNCRSTTVPHFEDQEVEERVARDEEGHTIKVPRKMTQEQYINTYVPEEDREKLLNFRKKFYKTE
jgi:SPP1 gp7 family putative phage head morphogenesis protein